MNYLLDTNTLIYFFKNQGSVAHKLLSHSPSEIAISSIVYYELKVGIAKSNAPEKRLMQLNTLLSQITVLPFTEKEADVAAHIRSTLEQKGTPIGPLDTLIAASALVNHCVLVTRNTAEFARVTGLVIENWF